MALVVGRIVFGSDKSIGIVSSHPTDDVDLEFAHTLLKAVGIDLTAEISMPMLELDPQTLRRRNDLARKKLRKET